MRISLAYVPGSTNPFTAGVSCDLCDQPVDGAAAQAITAADGSFKLDLSST